MRSEFLFVFITAILLFLFPKVNFAQAPNLGAVGNFVLFTSVGAISGTTSSTSYIVGGDIGTNNGAITDTSTTKTTGNYHNADALTRQAVIDLDTAYAQMLYKVATNTTHANAFGGGETLLKGVYSLAGAVSIAGDLILDGGGDSNAVFIFKSSAGAFTTGTQARILLVNGVSACNVVWVIQGAVSFGTSAQMQGTFISKTGAIAIASGSTLNGRAYTTSGAISYDGVRISIPTQCADFIATKWTPRTNSNWNNSDNWNNFIIPLADSKITIPLGAIPYPVIDSGINSVKSITIDSGASVTVKGVSLKIGGQINNSGTFDVSAGTIEMNGSSPQIIAANTFANNNLLNLIVSNKVTFLGKQNITGTLSFGNSKDSLFTSDSLTLKSTSAGTARLADITNAGAVSGNVIIGKITVERYISAKRSWRMLSVPFISVGAPSISTAWQEGQGGNSTSDSFPGYGVQITGGPVASGFDQGVNGNSSMKVYNYLTNSFIGLPTVNGTNIPITSYPGYFLFVRGNRSTDLSLGTSAGTSVATLRIKGNIFTGDTTLNINASNFTLVGNPYASAINFDSLTKTNVNNLFYVWDPLLNGANGVGGYVTVSGNSDHTYSITPSSATVTQYIQSGEAFFVQSADSTKPATLAFHESYKSSAGSGFVFKPMTGNKSELRIDLLSVNPAGTNFLSDGVLTTYNLNNSNNVDKFDARKMFNISENISIGREGKDLSIERRKTIADYDTTFLNLYSLKKQTYQLQITADGLDSIGLHAVIKDNYLGVAKDTALNMGGVTNVFFTVNTDTASYAVNRFSIVFKQDAPLLPFAFSLIKADKVLKDIVVEWKVENELITKNYEVEISNDGINFTKAFSIPAKANNESSQTYKWTDKFVADGIHYYRIKSININEKYSYSLVVNVTVDKDVKEKNIVVYGNILKGNQISLRLNNIEKGSYNLNLYSMDGKIIKQFSIEYPGGNDLRNFLINTYFPSGKYEIILFGKNVNYKTFIIKD